MSITCLSNGEDACSLELRTISSSTIFPIPISKLALQAALRDLLLDPEKQDMTAGAVMIDRYRDGLRIHASGGRFELPFLHLFRLVMEAPA